MSAKRYRMALEAILAVSPYDGSTMRRIAQAALPDTVTMPAEPAAEPAAGERRCDGVGEGADRAGAPTAGEPDAAPQTATPPAAKVGAPPRAVKAHPAETGAKTAPGRNTRAKLEGALRGQPRTTRELADHLGISKARVEQLLAPLRETGVVVAVDGVPRNATNPQIWGFRDQADAKVAQIAGRGATKRGAPNVAQIRTYVLECIRQGAGLDEPEIAAQLELDREHVALATGDLLADRQVVLQPDGTYVAAEQARAA